MQNRNSSCEKERIKKTREIYVKKLINEKKM